MTNDTQCRQPNMPAGNVPPQMRIQVASDLHLEFIKRRFPGERVIKPLPDADLLVLAGDIDTGLGVFDAFADWPVPILYVIGNHESYGRVYDEDRKALRAACAGTNIVLLDQDVVTAGDLAARFPGWASSRAAALPDVRFIGCTLVTRSIRSDDSDWIRFAGSIRSCADTKSLMTGKCSLKASSIELLNSSIAPSKNRST